MKVPKIFLPEKDLKIVIEKLSKDPMLSQPKYSKFEVIHADTYAKGIAKLREQGRKPFTFAENIEARIADYKTNDKNVKLPDIVNLNSITGIAYKANSTKFKLVFRSDKLENIKPDFNQNFIPIDYNAEKGLEFDSAKGKYLYPLTREDAENHEFWLAVMGGDKERLAEYVGVWFDKNGQEKSMNICLRSYRSQDELRALVLFVINDYSFVSGDVDLGIKGNFVRFASSA